MTTPKVYPPLIQMFIDVQYEYPDAIVAMEVGGFFEIWGIDLEDGSHVGFAKEASKLLDTVLTRRNKSDPTSPYMTGVPSHSAEGYFQKLVDKGQKVVIIEQHVRGSKSEKNKNITRSVTRILSPGTVIEKNNNSNNFFASFYSDGGNIGVSLIDVSTGEVKITEILHTDINDFLSKYTPKEILVTGKIDFEFNSSQLVHINSEKHQISKMAGAGVMIGTIYKVDSTLSNNPTYAIGALGLEKWRDGSLALANLLNYLASTEYNILLLKKLSTPDPLVLNEHLYMPQNGYVSLDVFNNNSQDLNNTLFGILNYCSTSMGSRLLKNWILNPLVDVSEINKRHDTVEGMISDLTSVINLKDVYDIPRLSRRLIFAKLMPHEMNHLHYSLSKSLEVFQQQKNEDLSKKAKSIIKMIEDNINLEQSNTASLSTEYDFLIGHLKKETENYYQSWKHAEQDLVLLKKEIEALIKYDKLKIIEKSEGLELISPRGGASFLNAGGFKYKEKSSELLVHDNTWEKLAAETFGKKQSFFLKAKEAFEKFQKQIHDLHGEVLLDISNHVAKYDVLSTFAKMSKERNYVKANIVDLDESMIDLKKLRHPIVEMNKSIHHEFVPNDISLGLDKKTLVIYGANSAGKSTILKSCAVAILMNQIGCFIAAEEGSTLSVFDCIMTRLSSQDDLSSGLSTFVLEMTELQNALKYINKRTLFLLDEIGRGTSVSDGESIAYATLSYLENAENKGITLFATHYHSLYDNIKIFNSVEVKNISIRINTRNEIEFTRKLEDGPGDGSYGLLVAKSCNLPPELLRIAENYSTTYFPLKQSRYNTMKFGTMCEICKENPAQETHHIVEQKQGKVKMTKTKDGLTKSINHPSNLMMLCSTCHEKITRENDLKEKVKKDEK